MTAYYLLKQYLGSQHKLKLLDLKQGQQSATLPLRMQAYERLSLFCERISLENLLLRTETEGMNAGQFRIILLLAIQQEYEHNITQQVYVSGKLWEIIKFAREDAVNFITLVSENVDPQAPAQALKDALYKMMEKRPVSGLDKALQAIKQEAAVLF